MPPKPAFSYYEIQCLVYANNTILPSIFTDELLTAIFWEEHLFNNTKQDGKGTAVGLGQVEPRELPNLRKYGIYVDAHSILSDPAQAVIASSYMLYHCYQSQTGSKTRKEALRRYAGYYSDHAQWRLRTIAGWEQCERRLSVIEEPKSNHPAEVMDALNCARGFAPYRSIYSSILFPDDE